MKKYLVLLLLLVGANQVNAQGTNTYWEALSCKNTAGTNLGTQRRETAEELCTVCQRHGYGSGVPHPPSAPSVCRHADSVNYTNIYERACPAGQVFSNVADACVDPPPGCEAPLMVNPATNECTYCESGIFDPVTQECIDEIPQNCMAYFDQANEAFGECWPIPDCTNETGKLKYDPTFDYCKEAADQCALDGGTYGSIGSDTGTKHVCIFNEGGGLPTCSSSGAYAVYEGSDGSYGVGCNTVEPPDHVCDATLFDCDGDGAIDDQDKDGCIDNGGANDAACTGTDEGKEKPPWVEGPEGTPPTFGTGKCDPTAQNYAECIGQSTGGDEKTHGLLGETNSLLGDTNSHLEGIGEGITGMGETLGNIATMLEGKGTPTDGFGDSDPATGYGDLHRDLGSIPLLQALQVTFSGTATCPAPTFDVFGQTFALDYHCTLFASFSGLMSTLMIAFWTMVAIRIFMSA